MPCVYLLASAARGTLYVGVTSNLPKRMFEHQQEVVDGFSKRYHVHRLVWYEVHPTMVSAIQREKRLKKWNRSWKQHLIERNNPQWRDLIAEL